MSIPTPAVATLAQELTDTQKQIIQTALDIGIFNIVLASVKTATDHLVNLADFQEDYVYLVKNDDIIEAGDTISDTGAHTFDITLVGCDYIPAEWYASVHIIGTDAFVSRYVALEEINGDFLTKFGQNGTLDGQFLGAHGMGVNKDSIFICDSTNNRIQKLDLNGNFILKWGSIGTGNGQFNTPHHVAANDTHVFVTDSGNDRVQIFDVLGAYVSQFGVTGDGNSQFNSPFGIAVDANYIYVIDSSNNRVQIFDLLGVYVSQFSGGPEGVINFPFDIAVNGNYIVITENSNNWVKIYDLTGSFVKRIAVTTPRDITVSGDLIYVTSVTLRRIERRDIRGNLLGFFGTQGAGGGQFNDIFGVVLSGKSLFAGDTSNLNGDDNIHKFI